MNNNIISMIILIWFTLINQGTSLSVIMTSMTLILMKIIKQSKTIMFINFFSFFKKMLFKMLLVSLLIFFLTKNLMMFFLFFEISSMAMFTLIMTSSFSNERIKASMYMFFYMGVSTFFFLINVFFMKFMLSMDLISLCFLLKCPMLFFHLWLPKAHVEANFYDSMILASILLKMGGYGMILFGLHSPLWSLSTILAWAYMTLKLSDLKIAFAYSSILHMNMMLVIFLSNSFLVDSYMILTMLGHAFISSLMFFMLGVLYNMSKSRNIFLNKSMFLSNNSMFLLFFFTLFLNMGMPPFLNFFSEMYLSALLAYNTNLLISFLIIMIIMTALFNINILMILASSVFSFFFKKNYFNLTIMILVLEHIMWSIIFI